MKPYPCIESTIDFGHQGTTIRLWVDQETVSNQYDHKVDEINDVLTKLIEENVSREEMFKVIQEKIPNVSAAQIIDERFGKVQLGCVAYYTSFDTDPHG